MCRKYNPFVFIMLSALLCGQASAQKSAGSLSFKDAVKIAFDQNPQMIEARQAIKVAQGDRITARTPQNPELEFEEDVIEIRQPLGPIGAGLLQGSIAGNEVQLREAALKATWTSVYLQVRDLYTNIILNKKRLELSEQNQEAMRQFFGRVQTRYESGQVFKNDFQRAKIETLKAQHDLLAAKKELAVGAARLNLALGRPMDEAFEIVEDLKEETLTTTYEELKAMTLSTRPDMQMAELELDSKNKNLMKERLSRLPSWSIGVQRSDEDEEDYAMLIGVEIPIWNLNQGEVKKAKAERDAQQARTEAVKNEAAFDVYQAYLTAELHQQQLTIAKKALDESNELFRLATLRYSEGKIDFLNYLDQVKTAGEAKVNYYEALFNLSRSIAALEISIYASLREGEDFLQ